MKILPALVAIALAWVEPNSGAESPAPTPQGQLSYMIVVTGSELLQGIYPDGHTHFLTRTLHPLGWHCTGSISIDDNRPQLLDALRFASSRAPVVLVTGGLGPTPNDITRETLAEFTGIPLKEDPTALRELARRLDTQPVDLPDNLRRQCLVPIRGGSLPNAVGTAAGLIFDSRPALIAALPGPPRELRPMVTNELEPYLRRRFGTRPPGASITIRFAGVRQSFLDQQIKQHITPPNDIIVSSLFENDRVDFMFTAQDNSALHQQQLQQISQQLHDFLGAYLYTDTGDSLEQVTVTLLKELGASLTLADAGTGGALAAQLGQVPDVQSVLKGAFSAPSEDSLAQSLQVPPRTWAEWKPGAERAKGLAMAAAAQTGASWTIGIGSPQISSNPTNSVWIAIKASDTPWQTMQLATHASEKQLNNTLTTQILNRLRLRLIP